MPKKGRRPEPPKPVPGRSSIPVPPTPLPSSPPLRSLAAGLNEPRINKQATTSASTKRKGKTLITVSTVVSILRGVLFAFWLIIAASLGVLFGGGVVVKYTEIKSKLLLAFCLAARIRRVTGGELRGGDGSQGPLVVSLLVISFL